MVLYAVILKQTNKLAIKWKKIEGSTSFTISYIDVNTQYNIPTINPNYY